MKYNQSKLVLLLALEVVLLNEVVIDSLFLACKGHFIQADVLFNDRLG